VAALTGRCEAYYSDHCGSSQEFISAAKYGYLFQGQRYAWQKKRRGTSTRGVPPAAFVNFIENHDQLANSGDGSRLHARTAPALYRAMTALMLLMPGTPMLFQGQEFGATAPFLYFADLSAELAESVRSGRAEFVSQFPSLATAPMQRRLPVPSDPDTFARCRLDWSERERHGAQLRLHRDLLALRRRETAFRQQRPGGVDGAVLRDRLFILRFMTDAPGDERLLIVNFGTDVTAGSFAEPLTAPPDGYDWAMTWSSESPDYGGLGAPDALVTEGWRIVGYCTVVLRPSPSPTNADPTAA
jgi:maltooligosyltrehalose trehalohydrolase